jgi:hypothetical protein
MYGECLFRSGWGVHIEAEVLNDLTPQDGDDDEDEAPPPPPPTDDQLGGGPGPAPNPLPSQDPYAAADENRYVRCRLSFPLYICYSLWLVH